MLLTALVGLSKRKQAREKRRLEYQDRRLANDAEHVKVTRAMRYDVLRRDNFHCVRCGRGKEDGVKLHVDHIVPVSRGGKSVMSNLQTLTHGQDREGLDEWPGHGTVTGHDILETVTVYPFDHGTNEVVAETVEGTSVLLRIGSVR